MNRMRKQMKEYRIHIQNPEKADLICGALKKVFFSDDPAYHVVVIPADSKRTSARNLRK